MAYNNYYGNPYFQQPNYYGNNGAMPDMLNQQKMQYQQPIMQQQMAQQIPNISTTAPHTNQSNDIIWVQGSEGAKAYLVAPNTTVTLWDSESPTIYLKTADANGVPSMRVLDFTERTANAPKSTTEHDCQCGDKFIPKSELKAINGKFDDIDAKIEELENKINSFSAKPATKSTKTTKSEE